MSAIIIPCPECGTALAMGVGVECPTCGWTQGNGKVKRDAVYNDGLNRAERRRLEREARKAKRRRVQE